MLSEQLYTTLYYIILHVLINADTLQSSPFITIPTDSDEEEANYENNLLVPIDFIRMVILWILKIFKL